MKNFNNSTKARIILCALSFVCLFVGFKAMITNHLPGVFGAPEEDLSFGWYVPIFSLYVLWTERKKLAASLGAPSLWGLLAAVPFLFVGLLGVRGVQVRFELLAFIGLFVCIPWTMFGARAAKRVLFPALFLFFCMPLNSYLSILTVHLRLFVSAVSAGLLSAGGMDVFREGNLIALPKVVFDGTVFVIDIANPCSGLRSIFALLALAAGYGYFTQPTWMRRLVLFVLAVPFAVIGNILRIMTICIVAQLFDPKFASGFYHDFAGYIVFIVALALLVGAGSIIDAICGRKSASVQEDAASDKDSRALSLVPSLMFWIVAATMAFQVLAPSATVAAPPQADLPDLIDIAVTERLQFALLNPETKRAERTLRIPVGVNRFVGEQMPPSEAETNLLVGAEVKKAIYSFPYEGKDAEGKAVERRFPLFSVSSVVSGPNKQSLHRPELCLPSQGFDVGVSSPLCIDDIDWRTIRLTAKGGRGAALFAYTFFNQDGYRTNSHEQRIFKDVWDRTVNNTIDRWVMVTVQIHIDSESLQKAVLSAIGKEVSK